MYKSFLVFLYTYLLHLKLNHLLPVNNYAHNFVHSINQMEKLKNFCIVLQLAKSTYLWTWKLYLCRLVVRYCLICKIVNMPGMSYYHVFLVCCCYGHKQQQQKENLQKIFCTILSFMVFWLLELLVGCAMRVWYMEWLNCNKLIAV